MNTVFNEKAFDCLINNIKIENVSFSHSESSDAEDSDGISCKSIHNKNKKQQQDDMRQLASTSYEKDV